MSCDWQRVEELFHACVALPADARRDYLARQCADDEVLCEVESLLAADGGNNALPKPFLPLAQPWAAGKEFDGYEILDVCGCGASAIVYKARNVETRRLVAIKVFQTFFLQQQRRRYLKESRAALTLNHPNVVKVYEIGSAEGRDYMVMDYMDGRTLGETIPAGGMPLSEALPMARMMAAGVAAAHAVGILHRDLKPANLMVDSAGVLKVLDFGLAKLIESAPESSMETATGQIVGTACYLSPEQAEGKQVDTRSDVFSLGAVLYEMLTGERLFDRGSLAGTLSAILRDSPPNVRRLRPAVPRGIAHIVGRCLEKEPASRYASAEELVGALTAYESRKSAWYHRPRIAIPLAAAAAALLLGSTFLGLRQARIRWARNTMAPRIAALVAAHSYSAADEVVQQIENIVPGDAAVRDFQRTYRIVTTTVTTTPSGATVEIQDYGTPSAPWRTLGQSPLKNRTLPIGYFRWRVSAAGYRTREFAESGVMQRAISFHLYKDLDAPAGMVLVPAGVTNGTNPVQVPDFWLDQFEVTNRQYQAFVDAGGYRRPEFWQEPVAGSGRAIPFEEEMRLFLDQTGRSGPATWEVGTYSEGKSEFPVTGVSWYEAAAYARFAGKSLPAYFQWLRASGTEWLYADAILMSNFSGKGLARVGSYQALDRFGSYDLAGNAKEWIWNEEGPGRRMAMGGAWDDAYYAAREGDRLYPLERRADIGFRCVKNLSPLPASFQAPAQVLASLGASRNLVADAEFAEIAERYNYQRTPLNARLLESDDSNRYWRKLKISFSAGYEDERVVAYLFLPRASTPPYQTVIYSPSNIAWNARDSRHLEMWYLEPLIRSGRAVLYPVLWGTYERHYTGTLKGLDLMRMRRVRQTQDVRRSLDYLESRQDMEGGKLAYFGFSAGAFVAPIVLATEPRFKAAILAVGGLQGETAADVDPFQFAPRAHVPVLMMNGRYDLNYPLATSQRPLFDLLGVPVRDKKMILLEAGHAMIGFPETTRASLDWLDHYLGPVRSR